MPISPTCICIRGRRLRQRLAKNGSCKSSGKGGRRKTGSFSFKNLSVPKKNMASVQVKTLTGNFSHICQTNYNKGIFSCF